MGGFSVIPATDELQTHQVYQRRYQPKSRSNNPLETVIEFSGQGLIDKCFPRYTERFHVEMRKGRVVFTPVANRAFAIADRFRKTSPFRAFVALTGGVDIHVMESLGWKAEIVLEHRPVEARDRASGRNLSEVHALNTLVNSSPRILLNEDIHHRSWIALEPCWRSAHQLVWPITRWGVMTTQTPKVQGTKSVLLKISPPCSTWFTRH